MFGITLVKIKQNRVFMACYARLNIKIIIGPFVMQHLSCLVKLL